MAQTCNVQESISSYVEVIDDQCPSTSSAMPSESDSVSVLRELCPYAIPEQIMLSLNKNNGDVNLAAQELLGISNTFVNGKGHELNPC